MAMSQIPHHISQQFDKELEDVRAKVLSMGGMVEEHLQKILDSFAKALHKSVEESFKLRSSAASAECLLNRVS